MLQILILMLLTGFLALLSPWLVRAAGSPISWGLALFPAAIFFLLLQLSPEVFASGTLLWSIPWMPEIGFDLSFRLDGLSLMMGLLVSGIGALIVVYAGGYLGGHEYLGRFFLSLLLFMVSMLGVVFSDNLILMFIFWELTSLTSYLLIGFDHNKTEGRQAALQALLVTASGGLALLAGFVLLGVTAGSFEISELREMGFHAADSTHYLWILGLIALGAFTKSAQFPFHFWLPGAMQAPTPVSAYLHSATMVKLGVFLLARLQPELGGSPAWFWLLSSVGGITMLWGAFLAVSKTDLKQILAYTTIAALGLMILLLGTVSPLAATAFAALLLAHALYKGTLFMVAGAVDHQTGTRQVDRLSGLKKALPWTAASALLASLAMAGFLPTFSFVAKELALEALLFSPWNWILVSAISLAALSFVFVAAQMIWLFFAGPLKTPRNSVKEAYPSLLLGPLLLSSLGLLLGVWAGLGQNLIHSVGESLVPGGDFPKLSLWHGFNLPLLLSVSSLALGLLLFHLSDYKSILRFDFITGRYALSQRFQSLFEGLLASAGWATDRMQTGYLRHYLRAVIIGILILFGLSFAVFSTPEFSTDWSDVKSYELGVAIIIALSALAATMVQSRLATIACLGVIGFMVATIYVMFSAPDLGLTQIAVETLTVILFALVIYKLPVYQVISSKANVAFDALLSISMGALFFMMILASASIQLYEPISYYHAENSWLQAYGRNVVNVILVDFRILDTLGELAVVAVATMGVYSLVRLKRRRKSLL